MGQYLIDDSLSFIEGAPVVDTFADISNIAFIENAVICTKGFYSINDGGASTYIVKSTQDDVPLSVQKDGLYANIVKKPVYSALELGFKAESGFDNATVFNALNPCECEINFPSGKFEFSPILITKTNHVFTLIGVDTKTGNTTDAAYRGSQTFFVPHSSDQSYILKIGGHADYTDVSNTNDENNQPYEGLYFSGFKIKDIVFSDDGKPVTNYMVSVEYCALISGNLSFRNSTSKCLSFRNTWEHYWDFIIMRSVYIEPTEAMFDINPTTGSGANCSAIVIGLLDVERFVSTIMNMKSGSNVDSCTIDKVQIEDSRDIGSSHLFASSADNLSTGIDMYTNEEVTITEGGEGGAIVAMPLVKLPLFIVNNCSGLIFNSISLQKVGYQYFALNDTKAYVHTLFYGYGSVYVGCVVQSMTFHLFTISQSDNAAPSSRFITINDYKSDKSAMLPAITGTSDYYYRAYVSNGTCINHASILIYKNGKCLPTPKTLDFLATSNGSNVYFPLTVYNGAGMPCVRFAGSIQHTIVPKQQGVCDVVKAVFARYNATITVNRYLNGTLVDATAFATTSGTINRVLTLSDADHNEYEIVFSPSGSGAWVELCYLDVM